MVIKRASGLNGHVISQWFRGELFVSHRAVRLDALREVFIPLKNKADEKKSSFYGL